MVRPAGRLIRIAVAAVAGLLVLAVLAAAALLFLVDADRFRPRIETLASRELGRNVSLGRLHWDMGWRLGVASEGGSVANAPGFGDVPFASWKRVSFGLALRPLLDRRVLIDGVTIDGLVLELRRDAGGVANWDFSLPAATESAGSTRIAVESVTLKQAHISYVDAVSDARWRVEELDLALGLEPGEGALPQALRDVELDGRLFGGPLPAAGAVFALDAPRLGFVVEGPQLSLPRFSARFDSTDIEGQFEVANAESFAAQLKVSTPSLRGQLQALGITAPLTRDPQVFGALQLSAQANYSDGAMNLTALDVKLDDTRLQGEVQLPALSPLVLRFRLDADTMDVDRYLEPPEAKSDPFELPVATLESLDAKGVLRISEARLSGATAHDVVLTVE